MATAPLFNGTATHSVRDEKTGRFANRTKAGSDIPLFGADWSRSATPGAVRVTTLRADRADKIGPEQRKAARMQERKATASAKELMKKAGGLFD